MAIFIFHVGAIHFLRSFISFFRSFILPLRRKCFVPTWGSFRPSVGIISSLRGDFEIPPLGFFRPISMGRHLTQIIHTVGGSHMVLLIGRGPAALSQALSVANR